MNTNHSNRVLIRFVYLLALSLLTISPSSCLAQQSKSNMPEVPITQDTPVTQTSSSPQKADTVKCKSSEEIENSRPPIEWKGGELNRAVIHQDTNAVRKLLEQESAVDEKDNYGNTPLINALSLPIRESKAMPGKDERLFQAMKKDQQSAVVMVRELLKSGADVNMRGYLGNTPLIETAYQFYSPDNSINILTMLIKYKADINLQNERGYTALIYAAQTGKPEVVKFLLDHGADIKPTNCEGEAALSIAQSANIRETARKNIIRLLQNVK